MNPTPNEAADTIDALVQEVERLRADTSLQVYKDAIKSVRGLRADLEHANKVIDQHSAEATKWFNKCDALRAENESLKHAHARTIRLCTEIETTRDQLRAEVEALRKANIDCVNHYDECRAEVERLKNSQELLIKQSDKMISERDNLRSEVGRLRLTSIQRECLRIGEELQRAAGELPDGYELKVEIERGYGGVYLINPSYDAKEFSDTVDGLSHCITQAIEAATIESKHD